MFPRRRFNKYGFLILLPFLAYGVYALYHTMSNRSRLEHDGVETTGYVVSVDIEFRPKGLTQLRIQYRFEADGVMYYDSAYANTVLTQGLAPHDPVKIRYVPDDPTISEIVDNAVTVSFDYSKILPIVFPILAAFCIGMGIAIFAQRLPHRE